MANHNPTTNMNTKTIRIMATTTDGELLDMVTIEIPADHCNVGIRTYDTTISPSGQDIETLALGKQS